MEHDRLLGRAGELAQIETTLDGGVFAYVEGHAGIGKTRLLEATRALSAQRGRRVLAASGGELEREFGYGVVRQLFEATVLEAGDEVRERMLDGPAALAAAAIGVSGSAARAGARVDAPFPVVHALYWLTANLAARTPLVLLVDDAHWADEPSLRFLAYLAGRLDGIAVTLVVAARPAEPEAPTGLLARLRDGHGAALVQPSPLSAEALGALLGERFGTAPEAAFTAACHEATAGNPFLAHELASALLGDGVAPLAASVALVGDRGPGTVARSLALRLGRLPRAATAVAEAVAVFGEAEVRDVATVTGLDAGTVAESADLLADADVLRPGRPLRFGHPIAREALYRELRPAARARLHSAIAAVLAAHGRPAGQVAAHLLPAEPAGDAAAVELLRAAAADAVEQGAADVARTCLARALAEPPDAGSRTDVLAELGRAEALAGRDLDAASAHLRAAAAATADPARRAEHVVAAAGVALYRGDMAGAVELLDGARPGADAETALHLTAHQAAMGVLAPPLAADALARLEDAVGVPGETTAQLAALAELGASRWLDGRIEEAAGFAQRALAGDALLAAEGPASVALNHALRVLVDADRHELALPLLDGAFELARRQGSLLGLASLAGVRAIALWRRGDVPGAEAGTRMVLELIELIPTRVFDPTHWGYLAAALVERGELEAAEEAIARSGCGPELPAMSYLGVPFHARARLRLAQGRPADALADLLELRARDARIGVGHLGVAWHGAAVEAALAVGDGALAHELADEQQARAERWCTPAGRGLALSAKGLATGGDDGIALLRDGAELLGRSPARLDHARALLDLGGALRRAGRRIEARAPLAEAQAVATRCGAIALARRAHDELAATGARVRPLAASGPGSLTPSELRVARLAAEGRSNREIAAMLFVTVRTVENHLARAYRKLDIRSRGELPGALE